MAERKNSRGRIRIGEVLYVLIGIAVVVLAIAGFTDLSEKRFLFPWVFALATAMSILDLINNIHNAPRGRKNWVATITPLLIALVLFMLAGVSSVVLM